jgi:hypothetical protein
MLCFCLQVDIAYLPRKKSGSVILRSPRQPAPQCPALQKMGATKPQSLQTDAAGFTVCRQAKILCLAVANWLLRSRVMPNGFIVKTCCHTGRQTQNKTDKMDIFLVTGEH